MAARPVSVPGPRRRLGPGEIPLLFANEETESPAHLLPLPTLQPARQGLLARDHVRDPGSLYPERLYRKSLERGACWGANGVKGSASTRSGWGGHKCSFGVQGSKRGDKPGLRLLPTFVRLGRAAAPSSRGPGLFLIRFRNVNLSFLVDCFPLSLISVYQLKLLIRREAPAGLGGKRNTGYRKTSAQPRLANLGAEGASLWLPD